MKIGRVVYAAVPYLLLGYSQAAQSEGAARVVTLLAALMAFVGLCFWAPKIQDDIRAKGTEIPAAITYIDWFLIIMFVWCGMWLAALMWFVALSLRNFAVAHAHGRM